MSLMPPPCIDGIKSRGWRGFPVLFGILVVITSFQVQVQVWFELDRSVEFLRQGRVEDARSSNTTNTSSINTSKLSKAAALSEILPLPYNPSAGNFEEESMQYVATVKEEVFTRPNQSPATPNFFEILKKKDCLPEGFE
jgi:hypothetical protein